MYNEKSLFLLKLSILSCPLDQFVMQRSEYSNIRQGNYFEGHPSDWH